MAGFWDGYQENAGASLAAAQPQAPQQPTQTPTPGGGGGLFGFLYKNLVAPTVTGASHLVQDAYHGGKAAGMAIGDVATGNHNGGQAILNEIQKAPDLAKPFGGSVADVKARSGGQIAEETAGGLGVSALNSAAPVLGGEELAGKVGLKALTTAGAKMGAKFGAAGGAANAMSQGQNAEQVAGAAGTGGVLGGLTGGAGGIVGSAIGKLAGKTAQASTEPGGFLSGAANKAGARAANATKVADSTDFVGSTPSQRANIVSYDKGGNPVGLPHVQSFLRANGMPGNAQSMENASGFLQGALGGNLKDIANGIPAVVSDPASVASAEIRNQVGNLGRLSNNGAGAAADTLAHVMNATQSIKEGATVSDVLDSISKLEGSKADLGSAAANGDTKALGQQKVYQKVIDSLHKSLDSAGVNKAVQDFKVSPELANGIHADAAQSGVTPQMAQHVIDTLDNAKGYGTIKSGMQMGVVAGKASRLAKETFAASMPTATKSGGIGIPSWEVAASLHNPAYLAAAGAKLAGKTGAVDTGLSKINPGAFNAGRDAALAPDAVTAQKLAQPGGGPATLPETAPATPAPAPATSVTGSLQKMGLPVTNAATGQAANQVGQAQAASTQVPGGLDTSPIDQVGQQPDSTTSGSDGSDIPGGTLQDLQAEVQADPKNAAVYEQIYNDAQKQIAASAPPKLNATQAKNLTNIQNATAALHNYVGGLNTLSNNTRGAGVGHLSALMGKFGLGGADATTAASLESAKPELAIQLAQAMNNGQKAPQGLTKEIEAMLPGVGDPPSLATQKIQRIVENLSSYLKIGAAASTTDRSSGDTGALLQDLGASAQQ